MSCKNQYIMISTACKRSERQRLRNRTIIERLPEHCLIAVRRLAQAEGNCAQPCRLRRSLILARFRYADRPNWTPPCNAEARPSPRTFQDLIFALQRYWSEQGCVILQPYDMEMGAGTFHTATFLRAVGPEPWRAAYVQPSRRPTDGRYGDNPFRLQHYYQFQVMIKPSPLDILDLYLGSLEALGFDLPVHDVRFVEDNWESPTLGAWGLGWEVWLNGMEITQFTYFQQVGGLDCRPVTGEITYGLERLAMYLQGVESIFDIVWTDGPQAAASPTATCSTRTRWSSRPTTSSRPTPPCCCGTSTTTSRPARACWRRNCRCRPTSRC